MTKEGGPPHPGPPYRWVMPPHWGPVIRVRISIMLMGNPESKVADDNATAFGMLVTFSVRDWVTKSMNSAAFMVGGGTGKMVCGGGTKAEGICVGAGMGVDGAVVYIAVVGRGAGLSRVHCISWRRFTGSGMKVWL